MSGRDEFIELDKELKLSIGWAKAMQAGPAARQLSELGRRRDAMLLAIDAGAERNDFAGDCERLRLALSDIRSTMRRRMPY